MCCFRSEFAPGTHSSLPFTNQDQLSSKTTRDHVLEIHGLWLWVTLGCGKWSVHLCMWKVKYAGVELTHTIRRISPVNPACFQEKSPDSKHHQTSLTFWLMNSPLFGAKGPWPCYIEIRLSTWPLSTRILGRGVCAALPLVWPDPQKNSTHEFDQIHWILGIRHP